MFNYNNYSALNSSININNNNIWVDRLAHYCTPATMYIGDY